MCVFASVQEESTSASETAAPQQPGGRGAGPAAENIEDKVKMHSLELKCIIFFQFVIIFLSSILLRR